MSSSLCDPARLKTAFSTHQTDTITSKVFTNTLMLRLQNRSPHAAITHNAHGLQLQEIAVGNGGGVASVHVDGFEQLMPIFIGVAEAAALVYATSGDEGRRPSTLGTWRRSLEVCLAYQPTCLLICSPRNASITALSTCYMLHQLSHLQRQRAGNSF